MTAASQRLADLEQQVAGLKPCPSCLSAENRARAWRAAMRAGACAVPEPPAGEDR